MRIELFGTYWPVPGAINPMNAENVVGRCDVLSWRVFPYDLPSLLSLIIPLMAGGYANVDGYVHHADNSIGWLYERTKSVTLHIKYPEAVDKYDPLELEPLHDVMDPDEYIIRHALPLELSMNVASDAVFISPPERG